MSVEASGRACWHLALRPSRSLCVCVAPHPLDLPFQLHVAAAGNEHHKMLDNGANAITLVIKKG